ncbi:MAG TPA: DUF3429 domain-containing protein [Aquabacterium sp.]|nr:DUF3429 domain-containing protein [Aquabacterium sp.]HQC98212.1 DUF3429 domain-containing protein [Aquabacterium sp.]
MTTTAPAYHPPVIDTARWLGNLGLLPFVGGALLVWVGLASELHAFVTGALSAYAALIVSFLGGVHWGFGFRQSAPPASLFIWGVVPSLVAWVAVLMPPHAGLVLHGLMLVVCYLVDRRTYPAQGAAHWLTLRFRLSGVAAFCCFLAAAGT